MNENKDLSARLADKTAERLEELQEQPEQEVAQEAQPEQQLAQEGENTNEDAPQQTEETQAVQQAQPQKEGGHFKKLRESLERSEREKEQLYELLRQQMQTGVPSVQKQMEPDIDPNDYVPRAYVDRRVREAQEQTAQYQQVLYEQMVTNQLKSQYNDFSTVLSSENIAKLREEHPEIAASLATNPDLASKAHATYKILKKLGITSEEKDYEPIKQKIQANSQKPRPATASPLSVAHSYDYQRMSDDEMKREREAMERDIRG